ncbi:helix-turn-helix domain-containing protein [Shumkonia mesophila]|uniref:helix-turn-helix domain-containing protein n=1 Tax=Shumkonia mesophila TaxID=2838854 RepID=UPI002934C943|nr:helix-turn-helix domain-containing protein [Shumkonia mesophila]
MEDTLKKILSELEMIRKIKMIELMERGYSQSKLGDALGISQATVSRMMAGKKPASTKVTQKLNGDE